MKQVSKHNHEVEVLFISPLILNPIHLVQKSSLSLYELRKVEVSADIEQFVIFAIVSHTVSNDLKVTSMNQLDNNIYQRELKNYFFYFSFG